MFLYLAYQNVHQPQQVPPQYEQPYQFIKNKQRRTLAGKCYASSGLQTALCGVMTLNSEH